MSQVKPRGDTDTKRRVWIICGLVVSVLIIFPWWYFFYDLSVYYGLFDSSDIAIAIISFSIFLVPVFGGVWAVLNTRRGIPWWLWVIGGILAAVLVGLYLWLVGWLYGLLGGPRPRNPITDWINMILSSTIMIPMGFGAVWAVYGLVLFCLFVWRKVGVQVKTKR